MLTNVRVNPKPPTCREKTQVSSTGIFLYILYPGAFVDISSRALAIMSPLQQLRVICAGVWHNAVMFIAAWIFLATGALQLSFRIIGWNHMTDGLSVVDIDPVSDFSFLSRFLRHHLVGDVKLTRFIFL